MSPRTKAQNEEIRELSRKKILDAALKLFATRGFDGTSISAVAKEAGVAKGLIYNYFESKEELVHQIVLNGASEVDGIIAELMAQPTAKEKLRFVILLTRNFLVDQFEYNKLLNMLSLKLDSFPEMQDFVHNKYNGFIPLLSGMLTEIGMENPEGEARLLAAIMDGIAVQYMVFKDKDQLDKTIDYMIQKYCE